MEGEQGEIKSGAICSAHALVEKVRKTGQGKWACGVASCSLPRDSREETKPCSRRRQRMAKNWWPVWQKWDLPLGDRCCCENGLLSVLKRNRTSASKQTLSVTVLQIPLCYRKGDITLTLEKESSNPLLAVRPLAFPIRSKTLEEGVRRYSG